MPRGHDLPDDITLFWQKVDKSGDCWIWTASRCEARGGYGQVRFRGRTRKAHQVSYELTVGPIPEGLVLDHLCMNPPCVNPDHLEPVTQGENTRRAQAARDDGFFACGHEKSDQNTLPNGPSSTRCRTCVREYARRRTLERQAARLPRAHCGNGHPISDDNTYIYPDGKRACRSCRRQWQRDARAGHPQEHRNVQDSQTFSFAERQEGMNK